MVEKYVPVSYDIINELPWIADFDFSCIKKIDGVQKRMFTKESIILHQDMPNDLIYYIDQGRVRLAVLSDEGDEKTIAIVTAGNIFGEISALDGFNTHMSVVAITDVDIYTVKNNIFLNQDDEVVNKLIRSLVRKNRLYVSELESVVFKDAFSRLVACMHRLSNKYGIRKDNKIYIPVKFTHQEMSKLLGCSRVTVTNIINKLKREKIIAYEQGVHVILDYQRLSELARII